MNLALYFQPSDGICSPQKLVGVLEAARILHWDVQTVRGFPTAARFRRLAELWNPCGIIAECGDENEKLDVRVFGSLPTVLLCCPHPVAASNVVRVAHDNAATVRMAARELLRTHAEDFAFIPDRNHLGWSGERGKAFAETVAINGKRLHVFRCASNDQDLRQRQLREFLKALARPCAILAANDETAAETIAAARHLGITIPQDIAIIGIDNDESICEHTQPRLSSVEPDFREGGRLSMMMLVALYRHRGRFAGERLHFFGPCRVVRRGSTLQHQNYDRHIIRMLETIQQKACEGLTAEEVAALYPRSRPIADIRFKTATGHSILEEIHATQLETAKRLLANPNQQLGTISDFCGFTNPNSLRKFFRRQTGMTLSAWRASVRQSIPNPAHTPPCHKSGE